MLAYHEYVKRKLALPLLLLLSVLVAAQDAGDPWQSAELISPADFAAELKSASGATPEILFVGFPMIYRGAHIPKAKLAGPGSKQEGIDLLAQELKGVPHTAEIVIYCGCCPFVKCPNIRPAYKALRQMGYTKIKVVELATNLHTDWVEKGYPIENPGK